jgi:hypothetical protein
MTDRPLAKYEDGRLWLDDGGIYRPATGFAVRMMARMFDVRPGPDAERYVHFCRNALQQYEKAMEEAKCEAAKA